MEKTKLNLFTASFPFGKGENFVLSELAELSNFVDPISIFPLDPSGPLKADFNLKCDINKLNLKTPKIRYKWKNLKLLLKVHFVEFFGTKKKIHYLSNFRELNASIKKGIYLAEKVDNFNLDPTDIYYSFWMNEWALTLSILKEWGRINRFVFRVNGYDIYDERRKGNYMPFRKFIFNRADKIYCVSKGATQYLREKGIHPERIETRYFGTIDMGCISGNNPVFTIISISNLIPLKRVDVLAQIIASLPFKVRWIHHGDGEEIDKVKKITDRYDEGKTFIHSRFCSSHKEYIELIKNARPDLFINLSTTEGLPVTIIEAISMGIPVLATNTGGMSEIVNKQTGWLVPVYFEPNNVAEMIVKISKDKVDQTKRDQIRGFWKENFSSVKNYSDFGRELIDLFNGFKK